MKSLTNPILRAWKWWFAPRSTDPTVVYRERALRVLLPIIVLLRTFSMIQSYSRMAPNLPAPYAPLWVSLAVFVVPIYFSIFFLARQEMDWAGVFFILHWYLIDMLSLPAEGYWYPGYQISLIIQVVLGALFLPSRGILSFMTFQLITVGIWGNWLDINHFDPPLLSSGQPVAIFQRVIITLAAQEAIIIFIVRYLRMQMEKSLLNQQSTIDQLEDEIIERHRLQNEREKVFLELEQRNTELERLAYTLSHELKSPLITIRGFMGYLREDAMGGNIKRLDQDIHRITDGTEKMLHLINELIDLMRVGRIDHMSTEVSLRALIDGAIELVHERLVEKNIKVLIADDLPYVYGDHKLLLEVFQILLENSAKFMGKQSEPRVEIGQRIGQDDLPVFYVCDNGIGIAPRFTERVFGIFDKLDVKSEGTGVGLALVKRIIEVHGGDIWVESDGVGKGSAFCFTIPDSRIKIHE